MIVRFNKDTEFHELLDVIETFGKSNEDFYFTHNNERIYVNDTLSLKRLLNESHTVFYENSEYSKGVILIWKSIGADVKRNYVKILADSPNTARNLLTILLWNFDENLNVKINKSSLFIPIFKEKGFKFIGGRGTQILLEKGRYFKSPTKVTE